MKNFPAIKDVLDFNNVAYALPELIVDWNMNRYVGVYADNFPGEELEGYEIELFPVDSIVEPLRPTKGINKARVGSAVVGENESSSPSEQLNGRYYVADQNDTYKYWTSPYRSDATGAITKVNPHIIYDTLVDVNKIVITTENSWATAKTFQIQVTTSTAETVPENSWTTVIATNSTLGNAWKATGQIVLYWNGTTWVTTGRSDNVNGTPKTTPIRGVRMAVTALEGGYQNTKNGTLVPSYYTKYNSTTKEETPTNTDGFNSHFDLIEISARLEANISSSVMDVTTTMDMGEYSSLLPIGTVTTNQASITLSNLYKSTTGEWIPGLFDAENTKAFDPVDYSPYANYIDANAELTLSYVYMDSDSNIIGKVPEFKMYSDVWGGQGSDTISLDLSDYTKFFNAAESKLKAAMWEGLKVSQIVWRILDSVGFNSYQIDVNVDVETDHVIPIFYVDGESNVWEVMDELAQASQTAIYIDSRGVLQVKTRKFAFSPTAVASQKFTYDKGTSNELPNIANLEINSEYEPNFYKISYQKTNWDVIKRGNATMQQVWTPEGVTTLRASPLVRTLENSDTWLRIPADDARFWPYEGIVNVEGELIKYEGKVYVYYTGTTEASRTTQIIKNQDEFNSRNSKTPMQARHKNHFNGALKISERGYWNSELRRHPVDAEGYSTRQLINNSNTSVKTGFYHRKTESRVELASTPRFNNRADMLISTRGSVNDSQFYNYGTRFRFLKQEGRTTQMGGIVIHNSGTKEDGYYFEFVPSAFLTAKDRATREEFVLYRRVDGKEKVLGKTAAAIGENIDYEMDIEIKFLGDGNHRIRTWLNGKMILAVTVAGSDRISSNGKFGMFARGRSRIEYEYLYALKQEERSDMLEDFSFLDKVERGYRGGQWDRELVFSWATNFRKRVKRQVKKRKNFITYTEKWEKAKKRWNRMFMDDFGPIVHEVREFDVTFDPAPVQHSRLYLSNDWSACALEYSATPFGAKFILANTSRQNAVVSGEDKLSFAGNDGAIEQVLTVFGRALKIEEAEELEVQNEAQILKRGKVESEISSPWIQSKSMANDISQWLKSNWSNGNENATMEVFGNPLVELGDVVNVDYPVKHIKGDFFVVGISNTFETGLSTTLTLRRRRLS